MLKCYPAHVERIIKIIIIIYSHREIVLMHPVIHIVSPAKQNYAWQQAQHLAFNKKGALNILCVKVSEQQE